MLHIQAVQMKASSGPHQREEGLEFDRKGCFLLEDRLWSSVSGPAEH